MAIDRITARLHDKNIGAAHIFENLKINFTVAKAVKLGFAERHLQMLANALRKREVRSAREDFKAVVVQRLLQNRQNKTFSQAKTKMGERGDAAVQRLAHF